MKILIALAMVTMVATASQSFASGCGGNDHVHSQQETASKYFDQMDVNNDQIVDRAEFEESKMSSVIKSFDVLEPDENGTVKKDAFIKAFLKAHSRSDTEA